MSKYEQFINQYPLSKTLRFRLIPQFETDEHFRERRYLETDRVRAGEYALVKKMIDRYHKGFIERCLSKVNLQGVEEYADLYFRPEKTREDYDRLDEMAADMRKQISTAFTSDAEFKSLFNKDMILKLLPGFVTPEELEIVEHFSKFTIYFTNFHQVRQSMYTAEGKASEVSERVIGQNLPKYLDNCKSGALVLNALDPDVLEDFAHPFAEKLHVDVRSIFEPAYFRSFMAQSGIDIYNQILGGYTEKKGAKKVQGFNELINLYNQTHKDLQLPRLKPLYKQILSDRSTLSFIQDKFESDNQVLNAIYDFCNKEDEETGLCAREAFAELSGLLQDLDSYDARHIYFGAGKPITDLSNSIFGDWAAIQKALEAIYDAEQSEKERALAKYEKEKKSYFKGRKSFSLAEIQNAATVARKDKAVNTRIAGRVANDSREQLLRCQLTYTAAEDLISNPYTHKKKLQNNDEAIKLIKELLDAMMDLLHSAKSFLGSGKEEDKDEIFYGAFTPLYEQCAELIPLYNRVRNYATTKPYSEDKFKLNFNDGEFLSGWSQRVEKKGAMLAEKDGLYYMMVFDEKLPMTDQAKLFAEEPQDPATLFSYQFQKPDNKNCPRLFIRTKADKFSPAVSELNLPIHDVLDIYDKGMFKREYAKTDPQGQREALAKLIDYFKLGFTRHPSFQMFDFSNWKPSSEYESIDKFYRDTILSCYRIERKSLDWAVLRQLVAEGRVYLFQIYSQDFSPNSHGTENLHTMYFKMLFDERNLQHVCFQLNGGAEMYFRPASLSLDETAIHKAKQPIGNKNPLNEKKSSTFDYDIVKNKRFTEDQYFLHMPITLNFSYTGSERLNMKVREAIRAEAEKDTYVIGIDRGERNLLYVVVVDSQGRIVEQKSLNEIVSEHNGVKSVTDYHALLTSREAARMASRQSWTAIEDIKHLKEGYLSLAVNEIVRLMIKYGAILAIEDLSADFKNSRAKIEHQVFQQFEKKLIDKLNFCADKRLQPEELGGVLNAYQLTEKFTSFSQIGHQNGFLFAMPPWMSSRIDPVTGFVDLLRPKYENMSKAKAFFSSFDRISYDSDRDFFVFDTNFDRFPKTEASPRKMWKLCSYGPRIMLEKDDKGQWKSKELDLTQAFKDFFDAAEIDINTKDLIPQILAKNDASFFSGLTKLTALMLQMQNTVPGAKEEYLISPAMDDNGGFFWTATADDSMPKNAAANGAYNIARKAQWAIRQIREADQDKLMKTAISPKNSDWLAFIQ